MTSGTGGISKQDQALTRGAQMVASARQEMDAVVKGLAGKVGPSAGWSGSGGSSFATTMTRWTEDTNKIIRALDEFEANLRASEQTYNATDDAQSQHFNKLNSRLG